MPSESPKTPIVEIEGDRYERIPVKTHLVKFGEDLDALAVRYVKPLTRSGDWFAVSEKLVSVCQDNVRHISTVRAGWLAKLITRFVKKYPNDVGFSRPEKMQLVVELAGWRIYPAILLGALGKLVGARGLFWRIAGNRVSEIDGFNPDSMDMYKEYAALPPLDPVGVCAALERATGTPAAIIDGNNINVEVIAQSASMPVPAPLARKILLDNPMGQDDELTPFIIIRKR
jgi:F420-0:gamma-glutamyl ligase